MNIHQFIQLGIFFFGLLAIVLVYTPKTSISRWAPICGLVSQPFFLAAAWQAQQYGMLVLSVFYLIAWCRGIYRCWFQQYQDKYVLPHDFTVGTVTFKKGESIHRAQAAVQDLNTRFVGFRRSLSNILKDAGG